MIHEPVAGHFARDALARGYRLGFIGSGDRHDGHPGAFATRSRRGRPRGDPLRGAHARGRAARAARAARVRDQRRADRAARRARRHADRRRRCRSRPARERARRCSCQVIGQRAARAASSSCAAARSSTALALDGQLEAALASELADLARGRVRLRARGAARRRRGVVEPDLRRTRRDERRASPCCCPCATPPRRSRRACAACRASACASSSASWSTTARATRASRSRAPRARRSALPRDRAARARASCPRSRAGSPSAARRSSRATTPTTACTAIASRSRSPRSKTSPGLAGVGCHVRLFPRSALGPGMRAYERWLASVRSPDGRAARGVRRVPARAPHARAAQRRAARARLSRSRAGPRTTTSCCGCSRAGHELGVVPRRLLAWRHTPDRLSQRSAVYAPDRFTACKAHHLASGLLARERRYWLWGYGGTGRALAKALRAHDRHPDAIVELHPRRIGQRIQGAPVIAPARARRAGRAAARRLGRGRRRARPDPRRARAARLPRGRRLRLRGVRRRRAIGGLMPSDR